ncbi:hypothetical protein C8J56DRAFT_849981 [Mycena floridula]|nr:hypothetical protein C8J56DRAFT_849981 [Mycena floridula]
MNEELPGYTGNSASVAVTSIGPSQHSYSLQHNGKKWLNLFVNSHVSGLNSPVVFFQGDSVSGIVEVDLDKPDSCKSITVSIQGRTTAVGYEEIFFLNMSQTIWEGRKAEKRKLPIGKSSWPFSFTLPETVGIADKQGKKSDYLLPPSFSERASPAYIDYRLVLTVRRGFLKVNQVLSPNFAFIPTSVAGLPSSARQLAYRTGTPLLGPEDDPDGWSVLLPVKMKGMLFSTREIQVQCTLAIATPTVYAVKSPLPILVTFTSDDEQALDIIATPSAIQLFLVRGLATGSDAAEDDVARRSNTIFTLRVARAFFWPLNSEPGKRSFAGEIDIKASTKPSFKFSRISIRYSLDLFASEAPGFVPSDQGSALISEPVTIATKQCRGVTPKSYAPPGYDKPEVGDFNTSAGYLENGDQRFLHPIF